MGNTFLSCSSCVCNRPFSKIWYTSIFCKILTLLRFCTEATLFQYSGKTFLSCSSSVWNRLFSNVRYTWIFSRILILSEYYAEAMLPQCSGKNVLSVSVQCMWWTLLTRSTTRQFFVGFWHCWSATLTQCCSSIPERRSYRVRPVYEIDSFPTSVTREFSAVFWSCRNATRMRCCFSVEGKMFLSCPFSVCDGLFYQGLLHVNSL